MLIFIFETLWLSPFPPTSYKNVPQKLPSFWNHTNNSMYEIYDNFFSLPDT